MAEKSACQTPPLLFGDDESKHVLNLMEAVSCEDPLPVFKHKVVFMSDQHLGSGKTAVEYLYEFLSHLDFDELEELHIVGDWIGGWERKDENQKPYSEMERRIFDILNYAALEKNVRIHVTPGNHDENLRPQINLLNARADYSVFPKNYDFAWERVYETEGTKPRRIRVSHGDENDPELYSNPLLWPVVHGISAAYDLLVKTGKATSGFLYDKFGIKTNPAHIVKRYFKTFTEKTQPPEKIIKAIRQADAEFGINGHTHMPGTKSYQDKDGRNFTVFNTGDWVESCTYLYVNDRADLPALADYKTIREALGFGDLPTPQDHHPAKFQAHRATTNRQCAYFQALFPTKNRDEVLRHHEKSLRKLADHRQDQKDLHDIREIFNAGSVLDTDTRARLIAVVNETTSRRYDAQKQGLSAIFNTYAPDKPIAEKADALFVRKVLTEFIARSTRKILHHQDDARKTGHKLDLPEFQNI